MASAAQTRSFAANEKAMDVTRSAGVAAPPRTNREAESDYERMAKMTCAQFDREFGRHMVADHQKDIAEYKKAAKQSNETGERESDLPPK
jgi:putative membrane protein